MAELFKVETDGLEVLDKHTLLYNLWKTWQLCILLIGQFFLVSVLHRSLLDLPFHRKLHVFFMRMPLRMLAKLVSFLPFFCFVPFIYLFHYPCHSHGDT